ncbi:O-methyltransferase MdmC-like [Dermacentor silvarum]|uniref:O-methyltransferase MdmC-like n=1 Tax=Dermacentor silvarum TaxID=543639 RepID=UPI002101BFD8|nr:O-methyltransferase MdmC-like [Dermacentor silvarum]
MFRAAVPFLAREGWAGRVLAGAVRRDYAVDAGSFAAYPRHVGLRFITCSVVGTRACPRLLLVCSGARSKLPDATFAMWATSGRGHFVKVDNLVPGAADYVANHSGPLHPVLGKLCQETQKQRFPGMMSDTAELQFFNIFLKAIGARNYLEIGVFTGVSALAAALALPPDGRVTGLEVNEETVNVGRPFWKEAGVDGKIDIVIGDAKKSLDDLIAQGKSNFFDFIFIDADKKSVDDYYERSLQLVRRKGIIAVDNVLWHTRVFDPTVNDPETEAIRRLNRKLATDERVEISFVTVGDGVTFTLKK